MIVRGPRPSDTTVLIQAAALVDGTLSFKARGILAYMLAQRSGHAASVEQLARSGTDGKRAVESGLRELEEHGYLTRSVTLDGTPLLTVTDTPGVGTPTPQPQPAPAPEPLARPADAPRGWQPSENAIQTAKDSVELMDWKLYINTYRIRCAERNTTPSSSEWLRWLLDEEQKLIVKQKEEAKSNGQATRWWDVA